MLNYKIEGDGPSLLLCHGFGISFNIWKELGPLLGKHFKLISVELPGIGRSPHPSSGQGYLDFAIKELESLRESLDIPLWSVLGYSSGSRVAEAYLQAHGDRVERGIFLCPAYVANSKAHGLRIAIKVGGRLKTLVFRPRTSSLHQTQSHPAQ